MTRQLQVKVPYVSPEHQLMIGLIRRKLNIRISEITKGIAKDLGIKQSAVEFELYSLWLSACVFGLICEAVDEDIQLKEGQTIVIHDKIKQAVLDIVLNDLQDPAPSDSRN